MARMAFWCDVNAQRSASSRLTPARRAALSPTPRAVLNGGASSVGSLAGESQKLINWGWQAWDAVRLFEAGQAVATVPVWKGERAQARLGAPDAVFVTVPKGEGGKLKTTVERTDPLVAPLTADSLRLWIQ